MSAFPVHPFPDVRRAVEQLDALRFTRDQKAHDRVVHQRHLIKVEHEPRTVSPDLSPYFVEVLQLDVSDEPERRRSAVKRCFDFESHLPNTKASDGPWRTTSAVGSWPQRGCRRHQQLPTGRRYRARNESLSMRSALIFDSSVWRGMPSFAAAPERPEIRPRDAASAASISDFSPAASVGP